MKKYRPQILTGYITFTCIELVYSVLNLINGEYKTALMVFIYAVLGALLSYKTYQQIIDDKVKQILTDVGMQYEIKYLKLKGVIKDDVEEK